MLTELDSESSQKSNYSKANRFIERARKVHDNKYDYSDIVYINTHTKITIRCPTHGIFTVRPNDHLSKQTGCKRCSIDNHIKKRQYNLEIFLQKAKVIHGDRYDYSLVNYTKSKDRIDIICKKHGSFKQHAARHLFGHGCRKCKNERNYTWLASCTEEFCKKANIVHSNRYDYSRVIYCRNNQKVEIVCKKHGSFFQTPNKHLSGGGCRKCSKAGISNKATAWLSRLEQIYECNIIGAHNGQEYHIPNTRYHADGYCKETNTVFEFYGDKWHGNPSVFNPNDKCHPFNETPAQMLFDQTKKREDVICSMGYKLVTMWEHDYDTINIDGDH